MNQKSSSSFIVGEWMWGSTIADAGPDGAMKILSRCAEMGITDIYLLVKGTGGKLGYLRTKHTELLTRTERDILEEAITAAHACGLRLHAWICNMEDMAYKAAHPQAGMWHYIRQQDNNCINLFDAGYRAYMADVVSELAAYDIDGLHFDYIRCNHLTNGWSEADISSLSAMGADIGRVREMIETTFGYHGHTADNACIFNAYRDGDRDARLVGEYRRRMVREYAAYLIAAAQSVRSDLIISAATMPEGAYSEAFAVLHYGQDYRDAAGLYDYICPMAYSTGYKKDENWVYTLAKNAIGMGNRVVMGLQAFGGVSSARLVGEARSIGSLAREQQWSDSTKGIVFFRSALFDYARITGTADGMTVKIASSSEQDYRWVQVDLPAGLRITGAHAGDGFKNDAAVSIAPDGSSVKISAEESVTSGAKCVLLLRTAGSFDPDKHCPIVRAGGTEEIPVYTEFRQDGIHS